MNRISLINSLLSNFKNPSYLEIGVRNGVTIAEINAKVKIGVDPDFKLRKKLVVKKLFLLNDFKLLKLTSDEFFKSDVKNIFLNGIDLVLIDGLHTFHQSLKDVINSLKFLNPNGFLVLHDCNPKGAAQAYPVKHSYNEITEVLKNGGIEGWTGEWNGDVWKTIVYLRAFHPDLNVRTIDTDHGLGVISFGKNENPLKIEKEELENAPFSFLDQNRKDLLGLISVNDFLSEQNFKK